MTYKCFVEELTEHFKTSGWDININTCWVAYTRGDTLSIDFQAYIAANILAPFEHKSVLTVNDDLIISIRPVKRNGLPYGT